MKMQNINKKTDNVEQTNTDQIKKLIILVLTVTAIFFIFYGITILVLNNDNKKEKSTETHIDLATFNSSSLPTTSLVT